MVKINDEAILISSIGIFLVSALFSCSDAHAFTSTVSSYVDAPYSFHGVCYASSREAFYAVTNSFPVGVGAGSYVVVDVLSSASLVGDTVTLTHVGGYIESFALMGCADSGMILS